MSFFKKQDFTVADIDALPEGQRAELFDGEMVMLASPNRIHQEILVWLSAKVFDFIKSRNGGCKVYTAPFAVLLKKDDRTYVEPDLCVICKKEKLDERGCNGAPDWIVEIVSPSSRRMDYYRKLTEYKNADVREYWIVDPARHSVVVYNLEEEAA